MSPPFNSYLVGSFVKRQAAAREDEGKPCIACRRPLGTSSALLVDGKDLFHTNCFVCKVCKKEFDDYYYEHAGEVPLCFEHYAEASKLVCSGTYLHDSSCALRSASWSHLPAGIPHHQAVASSCGPAR